MVWILNVPQRLWCEDLIASLWHREAVEPLRNGAMWEEVRSLSMTLKEILEHWSLPVFLFYFLVNHEMNRFSLL
jgi:hypothetical protein